MPYRHVTTRMHLLTFALLVGLAAISLSLSFAQLGPWALPVALAIAATKAVLVALVFMHLLEQPFSHRMVAVTALVLALVLVGLTAFDVATREGTEHAGEPPP
jgi:cytochrome c oxidase subunit 4